MAVCTHQPPKLEPSKRAAIVVFVVILHLALLWWLALMRGADPAPPSFLPIMDIQLFRSGGSGAEAEAEPRTRVDTPSAPSSIHVPDEILRWPDTPPTPPEPSPQALLIGAGDAPAPLTMVQPTETTAAEGGGTGGVDGAGAGSGSGDGVGSGSGRGGATGAVLIRAPRGATISRNISPEALAALPGSWAVLRCQIRLTGRLDSCRVLAEHPAGSGVRQRALDHVSEFRFRPPTRVGRARDRTRITVAIAFPPESGDPNAQPGVDGN